MAKGGDLRVLIGALAGVGLGGVALLTLVPVISPPTEAPVAPATELAVHDRPATAEPVDPDAEPAPRFDTVRVAPDGSGLVAGQAQPGTEVAVLAGEEVAAEATADADGRFVAFLDLAPSVEPRALSLRDEAGGLSEETVIVAPTGGLVASDAETGDAPGASDGAVVAGQVAVTGFGPEDAVVPTSRDLPLDRPTPSLARTEEPAPAVVGDESVDGGGEEAGAEVAAASSIVTGSASQDGEPPAEDAPTGDGPLAGADGPTPGAPPTVLATGPSGGEAPGEGGGVPGGPSAGPAPSSVALSVAEPGAAPPADGLPDHAGAPSVADGPGALPAPGDISGQAAVLLSDAEGVRVLQPALAPGADAEVLSTVALDAISYGSEGQVLLSGRASGGGAVRLYLDNRPVGDAAVGADGQWAAQITGSDAGTYTLRVDQIAAGGEVVSRIETPFLREAESELAELVSRAQRAGQTIAMRTVQPGNTLWAIARDRYGEPLMYVQVFEMNRDRIRDPDLIYPGQVFVLPATDGR